MSGLSFLTKAALPLVAVAAIAVSCTNDNKCCGEKECCGKCCPKEFGVQLYSVRELIGSDENYAANHVEVLAKLAEMGYSSVEAANYNGEEGLLYGVAPEQFKADVEAAGLKVLSSHVGHNLTAEELASGDFSPEMAWWDKCIAAHKAAGMKYIVIPSMGRCNTLAELKVYCDYFNAVGAKCAEAGMKLGYHNHSGEFNKIEDEVQYDYMLQNTNPEYVFFQMDVFWAVWGRVAPVEYFQKYPGRFACLHIKDHFEVGASGMVGFDAIFRNTELGGSQDFVVEMEGSSFNDILKTCEASINYLLKK